tara:strand:- start:155 stop:586 length:432 start_codon:yes stop_codon:yes gene_type:complete
MADDKVKVKGKAGFLKSLLTLDVPNLVKNFKEKPRMSTIKAAIAYTPISGMAKEIYNQFQSGDFNLSKIIGGGVKKTKKRIGQGLDFAQNVAKESEMNMGGMANARKKNMGLKYKKGGSVKSSSKKPRGTGAAIKGTKFKGVF